MKVPKITGLYWDYAGQKFLGLSQVKQNMENSVETATWGLGPRA